MTEVDYETLQLEEDSSDPFIYEDLCNIESSLNINNLLETIHLPKNLKQLTERLPKSNYENRRDRFSS